jgi:hypothetical protein
MIYGGACVLRSTVLRLANVRIWREADFRMPGRQFPPHNKIAIMTAFYIG